MCFFLCVCVGSYHSQQGISEHLADGSYLEGSLGQRKVSSGVVKLYEAFKSDPIFHREEAKVVRVWYCLVKVIAVASTLVVVVSVYLLLMCVCLILILILPFSVDASNGP